MSTANSGVGAISKASVLNSWKEIAVYVGRGVRTVQRWEATLSLPVRRVGNGDRSPVYAFTHELDAWLAGGRMMAKPATDNGAVAPKREDGTRLADAMATHLAAIRDINASLQQLMGTVEIARRGQKRSYERAQAETGSPL